jgi:hypothetical protein
MTIKPGDSAESCAAPLVDGMEGAAGDHDRSWVDGPHGGYRGRALAPKIRITDLEIKS